MSISVIMKIICMKQGLWKWQSSFVVNAVYGKNDRTRLCATVVKSTLMIVCSADEKLFRFLLKEAV